MENLKELLDIIGDWEELLDQARYECVFNEPLDTELFKKCMKEAYLYFFPDRVLNRAFNTFEADIYGKIVAYSYIPAVTKGENSILFEASTHAAGLLSYAILHPEAVEIDNSKLIKEFCVNGDFQPVEYDFLSGNLNDYVELVKIGFWD